MHQNPGHQQEVSFFEPFLSRVFLSLLSRASLSIWQQILTDEDKPPNRVGAHERSAFPQVEVGKRLISKKC
jgi:hypothetical protein